MASPRELAEQRPGVIPRRVRVGVRPCGVRALNARTRVREQARVGAREMRAWVPLSEAGPTCGGAQPSSEADLTRGASAALHWRAAGATRVAVMLSVCFRCAS
jgi:hypothetical protein